MNNALLSPDSEKLILFQLPQLQISNIVRRCDPAEMLALTLLRDAMFILLQQNKLFANTLEYSLIDGHHFLSLDLKRCHVCIECDKFHKYGLKPTKVNGIEMKIWRLRQLKYKSWLIEPPEGFNDEKVLKEMMEHLLKVVKFQGLDFSSTDGETNLRDLPVFQFGNQLKKINYQQRGGQSIPITEENLKFLLNDITAKEMNMKVKIPGNTYIHREPFKAEIIYLDSILWVSTECFLGNNLVTANLSGNAKEKIDYNRIMKHWVNGGHPNLEKFVVHFSNIGDVCYDGIETTPSFFTDDDFQRRHITPMGEVRNFQRKSDGRLATVLVEDATFQMCIWHKKHFIYCVPETFKKLKKMCKE